MCPAAFGSLLQFLYTGRLETAVADVDDCLRLAAQCRLSGLRHQLQEHVARVDEFGTEAQTRLTGALWTVVGRRWTVDGGR